MSKIREVPPAPYEPRTIRTEHDWVVHTADVLRANLESYAGDPADYRSFQGAADPDLASLMEQIVSFFGEPPQEPPRTTEEAT